MIKTKEGLKRHPLENQLNTKLNTLKITVHKLYLNNDGISAKKLHCLYKNLQKYDSSSLIDFYQNIVDEKIMKKKIRAAITAQRYIEKLKRYNSTIYFSNLSVQWALDYETWMLKLGNKTNTRAATFKSLNAVLNKAVKVGVISKNPIKGFEIVTENVEKESLTLKEIDKIRNLQLPSRYKNMIKARDMFLFSFYTAGMRFTDICRLKWDNIIGDSIVYTMQKSKDRAGSRRTIPLNTKSKEILNIYKGKNKNFVFPPLYGYHKSNIEATEYRIFQQNSYLNKPLKIIAKKCGINKSAIYAHGKTLFF